MRELVSLKLLYLVLFLNSHLLELGDALPPLSLLRKVSLNVKAFLYRCLRPLSIQPLNFHSLWQVDKTNLGRMRRRLDPAVAGKTAELAVPRLGRWRSGRCSCLPWLLSPPLEPAHRGSK